MPYVYADKDVQLAYHDSRIVTQLTLDNDTVDPDLIENLDEGVLTRIENAAARMVDNHLRFAYDNLPLTGALLTEEIREITAHLTWCLLWERRGEEPDQVSALRERVMKRLVELQEPDASEVLGPRSNVAYPIRSRTGKVRTMFDDSGYFDGIPTRGIPGKRTLPGDTETSGAG